MISKVVLISLLFVHQVFVFGQSNQTSSLSSISTQRTDSTFTPSAAASSAVASAVPTNSADTIATSVSLADALSAASTASAQQSQEASAPPVPLPTDDIVYRQLLQLVPGLPPLPRTDDTIDAPDGAAAGNGENLQTRDEKNILAMLAAIRPPRPSPDSHNLNSRGSTLRVLCVGDSMTEGQQGDWTWRYRLWQWFKANNIAVSFVGPYVGTVKPPAAAPPSPPPLYGQTTPPTSGSFDGGYAIGVDPDWANARHFGAWGRAAATDQYLIEEVVQDYQPDLLLLMLGFNDLGWFYSNPSGTINSVYNLMENARRANPNLAFAIANIPQRSSLGRKDLPANTDLYNQMLEQAIPYWNSNQSPVVLVHLQENYNCAVSGCPDGYDGLHPNVMGEYHIAQAFSQTLYSSFGFGSGPIVVPGNVPARNLPVPTNFKVQSSPQGVTATWDPVYGAYSYEVMSRIDGVTQFSSGIVQSNRYDQQWSLANSSYSMYVRALAGNQQGAWTSVQSAIAQPQTAATPTNVFVNPTSGGVTVTWDKSVGPHSDSVILYNVITWDLDTDCTFIIGNAFKQSPAVINGLNIGHRYLVAIEAWNANGEGFPMVAHNVVPGAGTPSIPTGFNLVSQDPTSVYATWNRVANAGGYNVYMRDNYTNGTFVNNGGQSDPCFTGYFLFPGTWNYQFCVSAYNGNLESHNASTPCPYAPSPVSSMNPAPTCPGPKPWCAGGGQAWGPDPEDPNSAGTPPGEGGGVKGGGGDHLITITTTINGKPTTVIETIETIATTDSSGHIITVVIIEPASATGSVTSGASLITLTSVGADGTTTYLIETVFPYQTTNSKGSTITATSTEVGFFPTPSSAPFQTTTIVTTTGADGRPTVITETLRPTTATYRGTTYTGTITQAPSNPTSAGTTPLVYASTFPSGPGVSYSYTSVTTNTHSGSNPILGPWPLCWFCPPGSNGIVLFGFSFGTIYPPGGPPPGPAPALSIQFPGITIDPQGNPSYSSAPSNSPTSASTSCQSTQKATSCTAYCTSTSKQGSPSSTLTCSSTTCVTGIPACSATATTTTVTTSQTDIACPQFTPDPLWDPIEVPYDGCGLCGISEYNMGPYNEDDDDEENVLKKAKRWETDGTDFFNYAPLRPRAGNGGDSPKTVTTLGSCTLTTPTTIGPNGRPTGIPVVQPGYATGGKYWLSSELANNLDPNQAATMTRWLVASDVECTPTLTVVGASSMQTKGPNMGNPSLDHAWERSWMTEFFQAMLSSSGYDCSVLQNAFFTNTCNYLQGVWASMPGDTYWDFVGVDGTSNILKTNIKTGAVLRTAQNLPTNPKAKFQKTDAPKVRTKAYSSIAKVWKDIGLGCEVWHHPATLQMLDRTNNRIYNALIDAHNAALQRGYTGPSWADAFKSWMTNRLSTMMQQANEAMVIVKDLLDSKEADVDVDNLGNASLETNFIKARTYYYSSRDRWQVGTDTKVCALINLNWGTTPHKRDVAACTACQSCGNGGGQSTSTRGSTGGGGIPTTSSTGAGGGGGGSTKTTSSSGTGGGRTKTTFSTSSSGGSGGGGGTPTTLSTGTGGSTSPPTTTKSSASPTSATPLPFPSADSGFNVYSDTNCNNLVGGYYGSQCSNECCAFPQLVRSYQFVSRDVGCLDHPDGRTCGLDVHFCDDDGCHDSLATGCGNSADLASCHQIFSSGIPGTAGFWTDTPRICGK